MQLTHTTEIVSRCEKIGSRPIRTSTFTWVCSLCKAFSNDFALNFLILMFAVDHCLNWIVLEFQNMSHCCSWEASKPAWSSFNKWNSDWPAERKFIARNKNKSKQKLFVRKSKKFLKTEYLKMKRRERKIMLQRRSTTDVKRSINAECTVITQSTVNGSNFLSVKASNVRLLCICFDRGAVFNLAVIIVGRFHRKKREAPWVGTSSFSRNVERNCNFLFYGNNSFIAEKRNEKQQEKSEIVQP